MHWIKRHARGRPPHPDILTPAEWRVLEYVREGLPNAEIAVRLGVSINTVRTHVSSMLAKLELPDRQALAAWDGRPGEMATTAARPARLAFPLLGWLPGKGVAAVVGAGALVVAAAAFIFALPMVLDAEDEGKAATGVIGATDGGPFVDLLALVPDTEEHRGRIHMSDLAAVRAFLDAEVPQGNGADPHDYLDRWTTFVIGQQAVPVPPVLPSFHGTEGRVRDYGLDMMNILRDSIGLDLIEAESWMVTGGGQMREGEQRELHALHGPFDAGTLGAAIEACAACPAAVVHDYRNWRIYSWGDDFEEQHGRPLQPPYFDHLGRGGRLVFSDGSVLRGLYTAGIEAMIDAAAGDASLADDEDFVLAAAALHRLGAMNAYLTDQPAAFYHQQVADWDGDPDELDDMSRRILDAWTPREDDVLLRPYRVVAAGTGWDGEPYSVVVIVHESAEAAEENARRLPDRIASARMTRIINVRREIGDHWGDVFDEIHVESDGRVVLATLRGPLDAVVANEFIWERLIAVEPLFQWEQ